MSSLGLPFGRSHGVLLSRLLWPMGVLLGLALWLVFSTILWASDNANETAIEQQRLHLASTFEQHVESVRARLAQLASNLDLRGLGEPAADAARFAEQAFALGDFTSVAVMTPSWRLLAGEWGGRPMTPAQLAALRPLLESTVASTLKSGQPVSGGTMDPGVLSSVLFDGRTPYSAFAVPLPVVGGAQPPAAVLVAHLRLETATLDRIAALAGVRDVFVSPVSATNASLALRDGGGAVSGHVSWSGEKPGDRLRDQVLPMAVAGLVLALVAFGTVAGYLHWLVKDLSRTEARSRDLLGRDPLSGLANRLLFGERLDRELEALSDTSDGLAVLFIDLDRFKDVNDSHGHQAGDDLIRLVAQRLINLVRTADTIARFGGDEFAIIQTKVRSADDAAALARRILDALTRPFSVAHTQVTVGASIGVALAPQNGTGREVLMGLADTALYQAKGDGRNRYCFFQSRMDETIRMRKVVEEDLRRAIEQDGLLLHYQPLYSADGRTIVGLEALVRWPHPVRGMISPAEFIAVAEERGLVIPLGEWVLRRACLDGNRWPGIRIAVNVSAIQFRHREFVPRVTALLEETGFDPSMLELELTEGVVVDDADAAESAMMNLRALGIHLALDDFGTGYSSLIYLRRFAFDTIKIDRSFLESMEATGESAILVHSMVHLGRALGLTVTAEGVETTEQHRFLQALGCHQLQGYLFSKPVPADQIDRLLGLAVENAA